MRSSFFDLGQDRLRNPETGLVQASHCRIKTDETGLIGFIEHGERAGHL